MSLTAAAVSVGFAAGAAGLSYAVRRWREGEESSRAWATAEDVRGWGLVGEKRLDGRGWPLPAFVYGAAGGGILHDWTTEEVSRHALVSAPSGAGKTWSVFYPTLTYGWTHSCVVHVRKKQLAELTAGWRSSFGDVIWLDPTSLGSARYNPLDRVRADGIYAIRDAQNLVEKLSAASGGGGVGDTNAVFLETAKDFSSAAVVFLLTHRPVRSRNFAGLREAFSDCAGLATEMLSNGHPHPHVRGEIRIAANSLLTNPSERFVGAVEGLMRSWLRVYQDTVLAHVTSRSDFSPGDLVSGTRPVTLYVHLPPSDDSRLAPFVNLLVSQIMDDLMTWETVTRDGLPKRWRLAWILDEAWRLGEIESLEGALADMRSYGMRALLGFQGLNQVIDLYGQHNSIFNNCRWVTSWQNGFDECKRVADMLGEEERVRKSSSTSFGVMGDPRGKTASTGMEWRPVIQAAHVSNIDKDHVIVFGEAKPIRAHRTPPDTWRRLVRPLVRPDAVFGDLGIGIPVPPPAPALPFLQRVLPGAARRLLPPPAQPEPDPSPDPGPPPTPPHPHPTPPRSPKRPRRRL